jgi:hypothetical protein
MLDIVTIEDGQDMGFADVTSVKAANVLSTQIGTLEYAPTFGVDLKFFLESSFQFQNESFRAYLVERLTQHQINVSEVVEVLEALSANFVFRVGDANKAEGFIL